MHRLAFAALMAAPLVLAAPCFAATDIALPPFTGIDAHGGAHVTLRHGATQRVTVLKGDMKVARITIVNGKTLDIDPCPNNFTCMLHRNDLDVEIVSPQVEAIEVHGGAVLEARGKFPKQAALDLEAHGGAKLDVKAISAETVTAEAHGGGSIYTNVISNLVAEAHGGGVIRYSGDPAHFATQGHLTTHTHGGGSISKE